MKKNIRDLPLQEITLRKYEVPTALDDRELARKFLLSIGMLQPGDSRDIVVDVFHELLKSGGGGSTFEQLAASLEGKAGASAPNMRRQLRRLVEVKVAEKRGETYRIVEGGNLSEMIENYLEKFVVLPSLERVKQYARALEKLSK
tara:strand:+ start:768 stop:1202 length:435 start_codon:yes stop_codon:yes gene_type:complete